MPTSMPHSHHTRWRPPCTPPAATIPPASAWYAACTRRRDGTVTWKGARPMSKGEIIATAKATFKGFQNDNLQGAAAQIAYHVLFAVVPLLIFLTALTGFVSHAIGVNSVMNNVTNWLFNHIGNQSAATTIRDSIKPVIQGQSGGVLSIGAVLALWGGKGAMQALMAGLDAAFDVKETRSFVTRTAIAIGLTIALGLAIVAASIFFIAGSTLGDKVAGWLGLSHTWSTAWSIARWPIIIAMLIVALAFLYWAGPNAHAPFKWLTPGSILAVILWGIATFALGIYFTHFASYVKTYGPLGAVLAFIFWIYVMALILLIGGELNAVLAQRAAVLQPSPSSAPAASA